MENPPLRPFQRRALRALRRADVHLLLLAPTGAGKSRVFETFLAERPSARALIVAPLVALARQHALRLRERGIPTRLTAGPDNLRAGSPAPSRSRAWVVSAECLAIPGFRDRVRRWTPDLVVIDEAHCVWEWGERFRPDWGALPDRVRELAPRRSLWLTATLPREGAASLWPRLPRPRARIGAWAWPEAVELRVARCARGERLDLIARAARERGPGATIAFVPTRALAERLAEVAARTHGLAAVPFHAGLAAEEKAAVLARAETGELDLLCATSAFGLGMDLPRLREAWLWGPPLTLLALAQLCGRVGRAGLPARATLAWDTEDFARAELLLRHGAGPDPAPGLARLREVWDLCRDGDGVAARRRLDRHLSVLTGESIAPVSPCPRHGKSLDLLTVINNE